MRSAIYRATLSLILGTGLLAAMGCGGGSGVTVPKVSKTRAAYVYAADAVTAAAYQTFFTANGRQLDLIQQSAVTSGSFAQDSLILVAADTATWDTATAQILKNTKLPVLGIAQGGSRLFGSSPYGLDMNWGNCAEGPSASVTVADASFFTGISGASVGTSVPIIVSGGDASTVEMFMQVGTHAAYPAYSVTPGYAPLSTQSNCALWSFNAAPAALTTQGQTLFLNVVSKLVP